MEEKEKKRKPGRNWDGVPRKPPTKLVAVRFPPKEFERLLLKGNVSEFIREAVKEKLERDK